MTANDTPDPDIPTEDLPPLQRWISTGIVKFDAPDLERLAKVGGFALIVEADDLGLAVYDPDREPVLWVDVITQDGDTREDFEEEMQEFRARSEGGSPALLTRVLDRARSIIAISAFRREAPDAADALARGIAEQVARAGDAVLHVVGEGFKSADGDLIHAAT
jgi:hypothetical protein